MSTDANKGQPNMETPSGTPETTTISPADLITRLENIRTRVLPILEAMQSAYDGRVRKGYPTIVDNVQRGGVFGLNLDPGFGVYFMTDGETLFAEIHRVSLRGDTLSAANREKFSGSPVQERHDIDESWTDIQLRNLISELLSRWNTQQTVIYRVDS
jgi:hypothetical protein